MTITHRLDLLILPGSFAVCRLDPHEAIPAWAGSGAFSSITRTPEELSVVCDAATVPDGIRAERGWRAFRVAGAQDFALVGVLAALAGPLAAAGVSVFAVATFDTDYLLVPGRDLDRAVAALAHAGHAVVGLD